MTNPIQVNCTIHLSNDEIQEGDLFFFYQHDGLPTIRKAKSIKDGEDWSKFTNAKTGEKAYFKVNKIEGLLLSPKSLI
jgi:hypothetical protein